MSDTDNVIWGTDFKARKAAEDHRTLEQQAIEIVNIALLGDPAHIGLEFGAGIDGLGVFRAPDQDPA